MADKKINLTLNVRRQQAGQEGAFETYQAEKHRYECIVS